jgi:hypothetical protein
MYPDLGQGSMMDIKIGRTWFTADKQQGMRVAQSREVTYMGPKGVETRKETQCVYIGWKDLDESLVMMIALQRKAEENDDTTD